MSRISRLPNADRAIHDAVIAVQNRFANQGRYDGHDVVNWLNSHRNAQLNDIIDCYRGTPDPVHYATIQIGNYLRNRLGQQKIGIRVSGRSITLRDGSTRNGRCDVSVWRIA